MEMEKRVFYFWKEILFFSSFEQQSNIEVLMNKYYHVYINNILINHILTSNQVNLQECVLLSCY